MQNAHITRIDRHILLGPINYEQGPSKQGKKLEEDIWKIENLLPMATIFSVVLVGQEYLGCEDDDFVDIIDPKYWDSKHYEFICHKRK